MVSRVLALGLEGQSVTQTVSDYTVSVQTDAGVEVRIETDFSLRTPNGVIHYSPGAPDAPSDDVQALVRKKVEHAAVEESGALTISFESGIALRVEPDESYEAWTVAGPGARKVVCMPGGEIASWALDAN